MRLAIKLTEHAYNKRVKVLQKLIVHYTLLSESDEVSPDEKAYYAQTLDSTNAELELLIQNQTE